MTTELAHTTTEAPLGLTFALPFRNAAASIEKIVNLWLPTLDNLGRPVEILLVDDGSSDGSTELAEKFTIRFSNIKLIKLESAQGYGASLKAAYAQGTMPLFFYTSTDPGWNPADIHPMLKSIMIKDEYTGRYVEVVNGHRHGVLVPQGRRMVRKIYNTLVRFVLGYWPDNPTYWLGKAESRYWLKCRLKFGLRLGDINSEFKLFRRTALQNFEFQSNGSFIHTELLAKANFLGSLMDEVKLTDQQVIKPIQHDKADEKLVFHKPKFISPVPVKLPPKKGAKKAVPVPPPEPVAPSAPVTPTEST